MYIELILYCDTYSHIRADVQLISRKFKSLIRAFTVMTEQYLDSSFFIPVFYFMDKSVG